MLLHPLHQPKLSEGQTQHHMIQKAAKLHVRSHA